MLQSAQRRPVLRVIGGGMNRQEELALRDAALRSGAKPQMDALIRYVMPAVHSAVARALGREPAATSRNAVRLQLEDMVQEAFVVLFARQARTLQSWSPEGGMSLKNFCAMVASRRTYTMLSARRAVEVVGDDAMKNRSRPSLHAELEAIDLWNKAFTSVRGELTDQSRQLLDLFFVDDATVEQIAVLTGLNNAAIYQRRSRLRTKLRSRIDELGGA